MRDWRQAIHILYENIFYFCVFQGNTNPGKLGFVFGENDNQKIFPEHACAEMSMVRSIAHGLVARPPDLSMVMFDVDFFRVDKEAQEAATNASAIILAELCLVRENPFKYLQNLALCDSVDQAETEIASLIRELGNRPVLLLCPIDGPDKHKKASLIEERLFPKVIISQLSQGEREEAAGYGTFVIHKAGDIHDRLCEKIATLSQRSAVLLRVNPDHVDTADILARVKSYGCKEENLILSGVLYRFETCAKLLLETKCGLLIEPLGPGIEYLHEGEVSPLPSDEEQAVFISHAIKQDAGVCSRLFLGCGVFFATQLRRYGGNGYTNVQIFRKRLGRLGVSEENLDKIWITNALTLVCVDPVVQTESLVKSTWTCAECSKLKYEGEDFFESHGQRLCSSKCMRAYRSKQSKQSDDISGRGSSNRRFGGDDGGWGLKT